MTNRTPRQKIAVLAVGLLVVAGCSGSSDSKSAATTTSGGPTSTTVWKQPSCTRRATEPPTVTPVSGVESDLTLTAADGSQIRLHWFPAPDATAERPAPTILNGPGWSLGGETAKEKSALFGALGIGQLNERGYNVLTWDPRGFGKSTGTVTVNAAEHEGTDVSAMLDWLATRPEQLTDADGDPRTGMIGFSYGGGIQLTTAAIDCRIDALVPGIAWNSLETSLHKNDTVKIGWSDALVTFAAGADLDPHIRSALKSGKKSGIISSQDQEWFKARGPREAMDKVNVPTLFVQGTVDTLFTLDEAVTNYENLRQRGVPTGMVWFCGGHGTCLTDDGAVDFVESSTLAWLDHWVKGDTSVELPETFQTVDQDGSRWIGRSYPKATAEGTGSGTGTLKLSADGGAGPLPETGKDVLGGIVQSITPAKATNAVNVPVKFSTSGLALGAPILEATYNGTVTASDRPTRVFAQLVDDETGHVIGNQITPIEVTLDGATHTVSVPLETISHRVDRDSSITLQLVATTVAYATPQLGGSIDFTKIEVTVPVVINGLQQSTAR